MKETTKIDVSYCLAWLGVNMVALQIYEPLAIFTNTLGVLVLLLFLPKKNIKIF